MLRTFILVVSLIGLIGCSSSSSDSAQTDKSLARSQLDTNATERVPGKQIALNARDMLMQRLSSRLVEVSSSEGVEAAIRVCSQEAPDIATAVSEEMGVRIGRTSFKLRNANNQPPAWAESLVDQRIASNQFMLLEDKTTAALLPIRLQPQCLLCHGPKEQLTAGVNQQLAALYPDDEATGFESGDLRGWFWVEVPPKKAEQ